MASIRRTNAVRRGLRARDRGGDRGRPGWRRRGDAELEGAHLAGHLGRHGRRMPGQSEQRHRSTRTATCTSGSRTAAVPGPRRRSSRRTSWASAPTSGRSTARSTPTTRTSCSACFPYGPAAGIGGDGTNEIDIEYSRWGQANGPNGDWTDYPASGTTIGELAYTFSLGGGTLSTSRFLWTNTSIASSLLGGLQPVDGTTG